MQVLSQRQIENIRVISDDLSDDRKDNEHPHRNSIQKLGDWLRLCWMVVFQLPKLQMEYHGLLQRMELLRAIQAEGDGIVLSPGPSGAELLGWLDSDTDCRAYNSHIQSQCQRYQFLDLVDLQLSWEAWRDGAEWGLRNADRIKSKQAQNSKVPPVHVGLDSAPEASDLVSSGKT